MASLSQAVVAAAADIGRDVVTAHRVRERSEATVGSSTKRDGGPTTAGGRTAAEQNGGTVLDQAGSGGARLQVGSLWALAGVFGVAWFWW